MAPRDSRPAVAVRGMLVAAAVLALLAFALRGRVAGEMADLEVYWTAGARAAAAEPLYRSTDGHYQFKYLPAFALLAAPLGALPWPTAAAAWFVASAALLPVLVALALAIPPERRKPGWLLAALTVGAMAKFFGHELVLGQVNLLFAVVVAGALLALRDGREALAGGLLVAAIVIKPYAAVFVPWLLARRRAGSIGAAAAGLLAVLLLPALVYGWTPSLQLHADWWQTVTSSTAPNLTNQDNVSIAAFYAKWLGQGPTAALLAAGTSAALLISMAWAYLRRRGVPFPEGIEGALLLTCIPLVSPQGWDYVFLIATPAVVYVLNYEDRLGAPLRVAVLVSLGVIGLTLFDVMGRAAYGTFMAWSIITLAYLVVFAALLDLRRRGVA